MYTGQSTIGIDVGTQSVKVLFYDFDTRKTIATSAADLQLDQDSSGKAEQRAEWWTSALCEALHDIPQEIRQSATAIAVSGQQHGFVALGADDEVLAPVKLWCDTTTKPECDEIVRQLGGNKACIDSVGNTILPGFTASKILSLKKRQPELYARLDTILLPHDYLNFWLTGEKCMEMGDASGTGFLNVAERRWSMEVLNAIDSDRRLYECLPTLRCSNGFVGTVTRSAAQATGIPTGTPVAIGGGDNMMGAIGTGNLAPGRTTISLGTSGTVYAYADRPIIDRAGNVAAFCSSTGGWLPLLCTMNCTVASEVIRTLFRVGLGDFDATIARAQVGADGVITLPFFNGERTPNIPDAKACILGLNSRNTTQANLLRSSIEGASLGLRFGVEELARLGVKTDEIILTGGGANSAIWRQMMADIMGVSVAMMRNNEGAAMGAALQAFAALQDQECSINSLGAHYELDENLIQHPNIEAVSAYDDVYWDYRQAVSMYTEHLNTTVQGNGTQRLSTKQ